MKIKIREKESTSFIVKKLDNEIVCAFWCFTGVQSSLQNFVLHQNLTVSRAY